MNNEPEMHALPPEEAKRLIDDAVAQVVALTGLDKAPSSLGDRFHTGGVVSIDPRLREGLIPATLSLSNEAIIPRKKS